MDAVDPVARQQIALLRQKIAEIEGRPLVPLMLPQGEKFGAVLTAVCAHFGVTREEALGDGRMQHQAMARQVAATLAKRLLGYSLPRIARLLRRDHSTILHAIRKIDRLAKENPDFAETLERLATSIRSREKLA